MWGSADALLVRRAHPDLLASQAVGLTSGDLRTFRRLQALLLYEDLCPTETALSG